MCRFPGLKKGLRKKTSKQKRFTSRKSQKRKVNLNCLSLWSQVTDAKLLSRSNLNHRLSPSTEASYPSAAGNLFSRKISFFEAPSSLQQALLPQLGICSEERFLPGSLRLSSRLSKASLPLFKISSQGPCKASASALSSSRAMQGKASTSAPLHHSINQTWYRKPTDMHSPPPNITT